MQGRIFSTGVDGYEVTPDGVRAMASTLIPHLRPGFVCVTEQAVAAVFVWGVAIEAVLIR